MFARVTTFTVDPARLGELDAVAQKITPLVRALPGMRDAYVAWRGDGQGMLVAIYESPEHANAAVTRLQAIFGAVAGIVTAAPRTDVFENVRQLAG